MTWIELTEISQVDEIQEISIAKDVLIFKHSTTCSVSHMAKLRLEDRWDNALDIPTFYLDVKKHRDISNLIEEKYAVHHESPQAILIRKNEAIYDASHFDISAEEIKETLAFHEPS